MKKRILIIYIISIFGCLQATEQMPAGKRKNVDAAKLSAILKNLGNEEHKGAWEDVSVVIEEYAQEPEKKEPSAWSRMKDRIFDWFAEAMSERHFVPEVAGHVDYSYDYGDGK